MGSNQISGGWFSTPHLALEDRIRFADSSLSGVAITTTTLFGCGLFALASWLLLFHPLAGIPGPILGRLSPVYMYVVSYLGVEGRLLRHLHEKFQAKVVRVGPGSVSISDSAAIRDIYVSGGGFLKDARYSNFNLGPVVTIFSSLDNGYRDQRAKAVAPLFSPARLRNASRQDGAIGQCIKTFVRQFEDFKAASSRVDILDLSARLAMDATTLYLLGQAYGGLTEHAHLPVAERRNMHLSANPFIAAIVRFGRFSLLPQRLFKLAYSLSSLLSANKEVTKSAVQLDDFVQRVVQETFLKSVKEREGIYQARLVNAGISPGEAAAQAKAVMFAGADSIAVMMATIMFHIAQNPRVRKNLEHESQECRRTADGDLASSRPYLRAVVREGLRLGMTNPTRMTRVVPAPGLRVGNIFLPPGTTVGCSPAVLHHDPDVFPEPFIFRPERWLDAEESQGLRQPNMERSLIPYGVGLRACLGKNLAQQLLHDTIASVVESGVLGGAKTCQERIELIEWFNAEIKGHKLELEW
ncbi:cytochrome p450 [Seiridium cupressi]